jgi:N-carbamoylputrescine amidase
MSMLTVALLQMTPPSSLDEAVAKGGEMCLRAAAMGADVALFPEMWSVGYAFPVQGDHEAHAAWVGKALSRDSGYLGHFRALARELGMAIALTYLEEWPGMPRNSVSLIDRHGEVLLTYAKVHTCDFSDECMLTPGDDFYVASLDTAAGAVQVGAMICYDREFPESARVLMLKGAELILVPNACDMELNRIAQLRARAIENMVAVALANYTGVSGNGHSIAFDPIAFVGGTEEVDGVSRNSLVIEAGEAEGVYLAQFDLDAIRAYRQAETWGNSYRKPRRYAIITSTEVAEPFVRPDSRR